MADRRVALAPIAPGGPAALAWAKYMVFVRAPYGGEDPTYSFELAATLPEARRLMGEWGERFGLPVEEVGEA